jgi:hypothetical protein
MCAGQPPDYQASASAVLPAPAAQLPPPAVSLPPALSPQRTAPADGPGAAFQQVACCCIVIDLRIQSYCYGL